MANETTWLKQIRALPLPAIVPVKSLPQENASIDDWIKVIREDPMLTIHLFRLANKMLGSHEEPVNTLPQVIDLLDATHLPALTTSIPHISSTNSNAGLLNAIGDSLVAASLMKQWFDIRQIQWTETDYWITVFYDLNIWIAWLLRPDAMEGIEREVQQGENKAELLEKFYGLPLRAWNNKLCEHYQLPVMQTNVQHDSRTDQRTYAFKQSALEFFLPFSHDLASTVRTSWNSDALQALCHKGEVSLGLTNFQTMLKQWVTHAAREYKMPQAALAARRLVAQAPSGNNQFENDIGFSQEDLAKAQAISQSKAQDSASSGWPEAEQIQKLRSNRRQHSYLLPVPSLNDSDPEQDITPRKVLDLNAQREIRRQFRNQKTWNSPLEVQESALFGLLNGFAFKRIAVLEVNNGFLQAFNSEGCQQSTLLRNLKMPIASSELLVEFTSRVAALWVNATNKSKASRILPPTLLAASEEEPFFLRSFAIRKKVTMLLYVDTKGSREPLNAYDYKLFREYCADWNTALNRMKL